ncbi:MAG: histidine phosphatase family protein [Chloroflexi bacterium]|nr:histidine phosphatase family protein [Chloroflexota bacterium]
MKLILARHGQTDWNRDQRILGLMDIHLNEEGRRQARALARSLKEKPLEAIYSSPLSRALDTARAIAQFHPLEVQVIQGLQEMDSGDGEGLLSPEFRERYGYILRQGADVRFPGGESLREVQERGWGAVEDIRARHPGGTVLAVSHTLAIIAVLYRALGLDLGRWGSMRMEPASVSILEFVPQGLRLALFNDTCHLREDTQQGSHK